jgi:O-antigen/teichoic acid export membrane protein
LSWNALDIISHLGINFCIYFVFLTLLGAENLANFIFISLICGVAQSIIKLGQNDFLIVNKKLSEKILSGVLTLNVVLGIFIFFVLLLIFALIFYLTDRELIFFVSAIIMSFSVLISIFSNSFLSILQKRQNFKKLFCINFSASIFGIFLTYLLSSFVNEAVYPAIMVIGTSVSLFIMLLLSRLFKPYLSIGNMLYLYEDAKTFIIPLAKTRPIMVASKNIDSFLVLFIGGDILLVAYNTIKKVSVYPLNILYGILDRWLYPFLSKLDNENKVNQIYFKLIKYSVLASISMALIIFFLVSSFDIYINNYFMTIGVGNIDMMLLIYGFLAAWPLFVLPTLIYPYAKVSRLTILLPKLAIFQVIFMTLSMLVVGFLLGQDWITFGYGLSFILMTLYIVVNFKLTDKYFSKL